MKTYHGKVFLAGLLIVLAAGCSKQQHTDTVVSGGGGDEGGKNTDKGEGDGDQADSAGLLDTPLKLLLKIRDLARAGKYDEIEPLVWPYEVPDHGGFVPRLVVEAIRTQKADGDLAYTDEAMTRIIDQHMDKFQQPDAKMIEEIREEFNEYDPGLARIAHDSPENVSVFEYSGALILLVLSEGEYKLVFWEDMTDIPDTVTSATP